MKKVKLTIASVLAVVVMVPVVAKADVAYNIGVVSLYKSKGVDQNTGEAKNFRPALQGGVDWTHAITHANVPEFPMVANALLLTM